MTREDDLAEEVRAQNKEIKYLSEQVGRQKSGLPQWILTIGVSLGTAFVIWSAQGQSRRAEDAETRAKDAELIARAAQAIAVADREKRGEQIAELRTRVEAQAAYLEKLWLYVNELRDKVNSSSDRSRITR